MNQCYCILLYCEKVARDNISVVIQQKVVPRKLKSS
jgi:hypothetical protein